MDLGTLRGKVGLVNLPCCGFAMPGVMELVNWLDFGFVMLGGVVLANLPYFCPVVVVKAFANVL